MSHKGLYICKECNKVWRAKADAVACHNTQPTFLPSRVGAINLNKDEDILKRAAKNGWFTVSLRWRDAPLLNRCLRMCKKGQLVKQRKIERGHYIFYATQTGDTNDKT